MKCSKCGKKMTPLGLMPLQDDYTDKEELAFKLAERFECEECKRTVQNIKKLNKE